MTLVESAEISASGHYIVTSYLDRDMKHPEKVPQEQAESEIRNVTTSSDHVMTQAVS